MLSLLETSLKSTLIESVTYVSFLNGLGMWKVNMLECIGYDLSRLFVE